MARMRQNAAMQVDGWLKDQKEADQLFKDYLAPKLI